MTDYNRLGVKYMIECNDGMTTVVYTGDGKSVRQLPFGVTLPFTVKEIKEMNRFEELRKVAEAMNGSPIGSGKCIEYFRTLKPQTTLAMLDLIELQHRTLESYPYHGEFFMENLQGTDLKRKSIAAYNKFKEQA